MDLQGFQPETTRNPHKAPLNARNCQKLPETARLAVERPELQVFTTSQPEVWSGHKYKSVPRNFDGSLDNTII